MHGFKFLDKGGRANSAHRRAQDWYAKSCPSDIELAVLPTWAVQTMQGQEALGWAYTTLRAIRVSTEAMRRRDWRITLEHELLHILNPSWDEEKVEIEAKAQAER